MTDHLQQLARKYSMHDDTFTATEFRDKLAEILFHCPNIYRLRLNLPFHLVTRYCDASTMILSNAFAALADNLSRVETGPYLPVADLKVLILESVADASLIQLWNNPLDIKNIATVFRSLEHILFGLRRQEYLPDFPESHDVLGQRIWTMMAMSGKMKSACIATLESDGIPKMKLKETHLMDLFDALRVRYKALPFFRNPHPSEPVNNRLTFKFLTSLEFRRVELDGERWMTAMDGFPALEELFLADVYLQTFHNVWEKSKVLWIGMPNERPPEDHCWIALRLRERRPRLRLMRAFQIGYHRISLDNTPLQAPIYDLDDPCGMHRDLSQRFVEVAMGYKQPASCSDSFEQLAESNDSMQTPSSTAANQPPPTHPPPEPVQYLAHSPSQDHLIAADRERPLLGLGDTDTLTYLLGHRNPMSGWWGCIDGWFTNCNPFTVRELHSITDMACKGMRELNAVDRRSHGREDGGIGDEDGV